MAVSLNEHLVRAREGLDGALSVTGLTTAREQRAKGARPVTVNLPIASVLALMEMLDAVEAHAVAGEQLGNVVRKGSRTGGPLV